MPFACECVLYVNQIISIHFKIIRFSGAAVFVLGNPLAIELCLRVNEFLFNFHS